MTPTPRPPLKVGDRVRVYDRNRAFIGIVTSVIDDVLIYVRGVFSGSLEGGFHPRQCVRIKPRPKPAPYAGKAPREAWIDRDALETLAAGLEVLATPEDTGNGVRFVECPPGHAVVSREALAKAFSENIALRQYDDVHKQTAFNAFCDALGLKGEGERG